MLALQARVQEARRPHTKLVNSPKGDHQANGRAEKGSQVFQNLALRMKLALEGKLGVKLPHTHPVMYWLIEWVGGAHNRFRQKSSWCYVTRQREFESICVALQSGLHQQNPLGFEYYSRLKVSLSYLN